MSRLFVQRQRQPPPVSFFQDPRQLDGNTNTTGHDTVTLPNGWLSMRIVRIVSHLVSLASLRFSRPPMHSRASSVVCIMTSDYLSGVRERHASLKRKKKKRKKEKKSHGHLPGRWFLAWFGRTTWAHLRKRYISISRMSERWRGPLYFWIEFFGGEELVETHCQRLQIL